MSQRWDGKTWEMSVEDPRNLIPVADVFAVGGKFALEPIGGTYRVINPDGPLPEAWHTCSLTEVGTGWPDITPPIYQPAYDIPFALAGRERFASLPGNPRALVTTLLDKRGAYLCDIRLYQVPEQLKNSIGERCDLLIIYAENRNGRHLNGGTGYGHS
jgi:hypothetical protein